MAGGCLPTNELDYDVIIILSSTPVLNTQKALAVATTKILLISTYTCTCM